jgi:CHASE3 domain sensor protein
MPAKKSNKKLLRNLISFLFSAAISLIIIVSLFSFFQFKKLIKISDWVDHTYRVIITAQQVLENITYIETLQRGYLLFNDQDYKFEYEKTIASINSSVNMLISLVSDNTTQQNRVFEIQSLVKKRLELIYQMNKMKSEHKLYASQLSHLFDNRKMILNQIRDGILLILGQTTSIIFLIFAFISIYFSRKEINTKEKQLRGIIDSAKDIIVVVDPKMRFLIFKERVPNNFPN